MATHPNTPITDRFAGRHIAVSGAGTGIGRAIAERLWLEGATLTLLARDATRLEATALACQANRMGDGSELGYASCNVRDRARLDEVLATAASERGAFHAFVANAGVGGSNEDGPEDRFDEILSTNLTGTYNSFRATQPHLADGKEGSRHLVAISSILGRIGVPGYTGYCASKTGILGLVRALAAELADQEIQVNAICPGWVDTQMARDGIDGMAQGMGVSSEEAYKIAMQAVPLGRMSEVGDVAGMVAWLISNDARGVTGQSLDMNGGAFM